MAKQLHIKKQLNDSKTSKSDNSLSPQKTTTHEQQSQKLSDDINDFVAELFEAHNQQLVGYLCNYCNNQQEAKDVAQEAYVKLLGLDSASSDNTSNYLRAYLFKIAKNIAIDRLRRGQTFNKIAYQIRKTQQQYSNEEPEASAIASRKLDLLEELIEQLPPKCRTAFILYKFKNKSFQEIAKKMQLTESMIRKYITRAIVFCKSGIE